MDGLQLAVRDYRLYIFVLLQHISLASQSFQYFFPTIVGTLGYGKIVTLWLTAPVWFATFLISICVTWTSARFEDRSLHIICLIVAALALVLRFVHIRENKKLEQAEAQARDGTTREGRQPAAGFRYIY